MDRLVQTLYGGAMNGDASEPPVEDTRHRSAATPKTRRGQASRERLVEAALAAVVDHGVKQMRVDEVLAAAGSSKSQMYHYFSDRDALIDAAVARRCQGFLDLLGHAFAGVSSLETLGSVLEGFVSDYATHLSGCPVGTLASELTAGPEPARQTTVEAFGAWEDYLAAALQRIQDAGELRAECDAGELALGLLAGLEGGMFLSQVRRSERPLRIALETALAYLESLRPALD
jgi:TetR/AcrR family transcriptional regulator, transcriptional repressor for nem operon